MGLIQRTLDAIRGGNWKTKQERTNYLRVSALCSAYENVFSQVRAMVDAMVGVPVYGVSATGKQLNITRTPELSVLADPNDAMGQIEFLDACFVTWLTEKELNIHVHKNGRGKVQGYTVLPAGCRHDRNGEDIFEVTTSDNKMVTLRDDEVMTLRFSRNPISLDEGVSPASSIFTWSQVDDLMAQLQKARLENGAYPATITFIRARTRADYEKKKDDLERGLKGAKNANKTVYIYRQQLDDGTTGDEMEVKTINSPNSQLAIREIMDVVSDKINKAFGVSNFIMGDDASAKYDNAELSNLQFLEHRVYPALVRFWSQFQHELDRITGGIGYAIQFDLPIPELTERRKVKAETNKITAETLTAMVNAGASPSAAVAALGLDEQWLQVALGIKSLSVLASTVETSQVDDAKNKNLLPSTTTVRDALYSPTQPEASTPEKTEDDADPDEPHVPEFQFSEGSEKKIYDKLMEVAQAIADDLDYDVDEVATDIALILAEEAEEGGVEGAENIEELTTEEAVKTAIGNALESHELKVSPELREGLQKRADTLTRKFAEDAAKVVAETLSQAKERALSASQIKTQLSKVMPRARAEMIARNEVGHAFEAGRLERDEIISEQYGIKIAKVWRCHHDERTCPVCEAMDGEQVELREAFPDHVEREVDGQIQTFAFDHNEWNDNGEEPHCHVGCRCTFDEVILS